MSEDRQKQWTAIKQEVSEMTELLSRNLGKNRKLQNCKFDEKTNFQGRFFAFFPKNFRK